MTVVANPPDRETARILMTLVDSGKSWLQDVGGVETAVIEVTDAARILAGAARANLPDPICIHGNDPATCEDRPDGRCITRRGRSCPACGKPVSDLCIHITRLLDAIGSFGGPT